jgi:hypothetical protein
MSGGYKRSLRAFSRREAFEWACADGLLSEDADAFAKWFVQTYPDPRFRPTYSEDAKIFYGDADARESVAWPNAD